MNKPNCKGKAPQSLMCDHTLGCENQPAHVWGYCGDETTLGGLS